MTITQQPSEYSFAGNLPDIRITSDEELTISLKHYSTGEDLFEEVYTPDADDKIIVQLREFFEGYLSVNVPGISFGSVHQSTGYGRFVVTIDETEIDFYVISGGGKNIPFDTIGKRFFTWQPYTKYVKSEDPEFLTFFAKVASLARAKIYYGDGESVTVTLASLPANQLTTFQVSPYFIAAEYADLTKIEVWVAELTEGSSGSGSGSGSGGGLPSGEISSLQTYVLTNETFDYDDLFLFTNSIGGIDTIRFTGTLEQIEEFEIDQAIFDRERDEYLSESARVWNKNTGDFRSRHEQLWARDFFGSIAKYRFQYYQLLKIITVSTNLPAVRLGLINYDFQYAESEPLDYQDYYDFTPPPPPIQPLAIDDLVAEAEVNEITLTWTPSDPDAEYQEVYRAETADGPYQLVEAISNSDQEYLDDSGLEYNQQYCYKIATIKRGLYAFSNVACATTALPNPLQIYGSALEFWWRSDDVEINPGNGLVEQFNDKSTKGRPIYQATAATQPDRKTGGIDGHPYIEFRLDGLGNLSVTGLGNLSSDMGGAIEGPLCIFLVHKFAPTANSSGAQKVHLADNDPTRTVNNGGLYIYDGASTGDTKFYLNRDEKSRIDHTLGLGYASETFLVSLYAPLIEADMKIFKNGLDITHPIQPSRPDTDYDDITSLAMGKQSWNNQSQPELEHYEAFAVADMDAAKFNQVHDYLAERYPSLSITNPNLS